MKIYIYCPFSFTDLGRSREDIDKHRELDKESMLSLSASGLGKPDLANYVPNQRLEWKRYKQYTRNDIMAAIEEVKSGMKFCFVSILLKHFTYSPFRLKNDRFSLGKQKMKKNPGSTRIKPIFSSINLHYFF